MNNGQDHDILLTMTRAEVPLTTYAIAKVSGISVPQVNYRMTKLLDYAIVSKIEENNKTLYRPHPILESHEDIETIAEFLTDIVSIICKAEEVGIDGIKKILAFMIDRIEFEEIENGEEDDDGET